MISEEIYSDELKEVFEFHNDRILTEHPTTTVTIPYFILSILSVKTTKASSVMERMVTSASLDMIYMTLLEDVHKNELLSMRPNKKYQIHPDLEKLFEKANQERENMGEDKLSTIHIILALLTGNTSYRNVFEMVGINYQTFLSPKNHQLS